MNRRWQFDWRLLMFSGLLLPVLLSLGVWQLNRAEEKQLLLAAWQQQASQADWPEIVSGELEKEQPVVLTGWYTEYTWLLDNRTRDGVPGYEVLTLFTPVEGPSLVVNRGWVRGPRTRDQLPEIDTPDGLFTLEGRLDDYPVPPVLAEDTDHASGWLRRGRARRTATVADNACTRLGQRPAWSVVSDRDITPLTLPHS